MFISPLILGFAALWVLVYGGGNSRAISVVTGDADALARSYAPMNRHIMSDLHPSHAYKRAQVVTGTTTVTNETGDDLSPADPINEDGIPVLVLPREFQGMNDHYGEHYNYTGIKRSDVEEVYNQLRLMSVEEIQGFAVDAAKATHKASYSTPGGAHHTDAEMAAVIKYSQEQGVDVEVLP